MRLRETVGWDDPESEMPLVRRELRGTEGVISLSSRLMDFDTPEHIREAAKKAIDEGFTRYPPSEGFPELRKALADKLSKENNLEVDWSTEVLVTNGANEAMFDTIQSLVGSEDEVIVADPGYSAYPMIVDLAMAKPVYVSVREERDFRIDPEDIKEKISPRTKLIITVSPDNPTSSVLTEADLKAISEIAVDHDLFVINDVVYEKIMYENNKCSLMAALPNMKERTITIGGFSKAYAMTGWRVGFLVGDKNIVRPIAALHTMNVTQGNSISQKAALAALKGPQPTHIWKELELRRNVLVDGLNDIPGITCRKPKGGICAMPNVSSFKLSSLEFAKYLAREAQVLTHPATAFGQGAARGKGGEGYLAVAFSAVSQDNIKRALERIKSAVGKLTVH